MTAHPGVTYYNIEKPFMDWRISWRPGHPMFAIEKHTTIGEAIGRPQRGGVVSWQDWSVVNHDGIGDDHNKAYEYAQELFTRCVNGEIKSDR